MSAVVPRFERSGFLEQSVHTADKQRIIKRAALVIKGGPFLCRYFRILEES